PGPGLTGQEVEPRAQFERGFADEGEVPNVQAADHSGVPPRAGRSRRDANRGILGCQGPDRVLTYGSGAACAILNPFEGEPGMNQLTVLVAAATATPGQTDVLRMVSESGALVKAIL